MAVELIDTELGQVRVETGAGLVTKIEHEGGRNAHVTFKATHTNLTEPVKAWADTQDPATWDLVRGAEGGGQVLEYRIEVHRKRTYADKAKPIAEVPKREKVRDLVAVALPGQMGRADQLPTPPPYKPGTPVPDDPPDDAAGDPDGGAGWLTEAGQAATEQRTAHKATSTPQAPATPAHSCAPCKYVADTGAELLAHSRSAAHRATLEALRGGQRDAQAAAAVTFDAGADPRARPVPTPAARRPKVQEGKPYELYNSDNSLNLDSYSYRAVVDFVEFAHYLATKRLEDARASGDAGAEFTLGQVEALAKMLLGAADRVQAGIRADGRADRMDGSHFRARGAVRTALKVYPVPWGVDGPTRKAWLDDVVAHATAILTISLDIFRAHETGEGPA